MSSIKSSSAVGGETSFLSSFHPLQQMSGTVSTAATTATSHYSHSQQKTQSQNEARRPFFKTTFPIVVRSATSTSVGVGGGQLSKEIQNLKVTPHAPKEPLFLQSEPPCYLGPLDDFHIKHPDPPPTFSSSQPCHFEGMTLTELSKKFYSNHAVFSRTEIALLLDKIFPPRQFVFGDVKSKWESYVSKEPAFASERLKLFEKFDQETQNLAVHSKTAKSAASATAASTVLDELIQDLFDEVLRQQIIDKPQLGLLMLNLRNGWNRILLSLSSLIESSQLKAMRLSTVLGGTVAKVQGNLDRGTLELRHLEAELRHLEATILKTATSQEKELDDLVQKQSREEEFFKNLCSQAKSQITHFERPDLHEDDEKSNKHNRKGSVTGKKSSTTSSSRPVIIGSTAGLGEGYNPATSKIGQALMSRSKTKSKSSKSPGKK